MNGQPLPFGKVCQFQLAPSEKILGVNAFVSRSPGQVIPAPFNPPERQVITVGKVAVGAEKRGLSHRVHEPVFDHIAHRIQELLLCGGTVQTGLCAKGARQQMTLPLDSLVGETGNHGVGVPLERGDPIQIVGMVDANARLHVIDVGIGPENVDRIVLLGTHQRRSDDVDDAGLGNEFVVRVESSGIAVPSEQGLIWQVIGFEGKLPVSDSLHSGVDIMRLPQPETFAHGKVMSARGVPLIQTGIGLKNQAHANCKRRRATAKRRPPVIFADPGML